MTEARLADQLEQVELDLADLDDQVASGELDEATADRLRATYLAEAERLRLLIEEPEAPRPGGRSRGRMVAGGVVLVLGLTVIVVAAVASLGDRTPGGNLTGGVATDVLTGGIDLDEVSNEQLEEVVADNPDIVPMRLALARRYFQEGEFASALPHYMYILEDLGRPEPEALANVGWMTALSGRPDVGLEFVQRALEVEPDFPQAYWFLANIQAVLEDHCAAVESLSALFGFDDVPDDIRSEAQTLLESSEASCDG